MQKLSKKILFNLEARGLKLFGKEKNEVIVCKPLTSKGNCLENFIFTPIHEMEIVNGNLESLKNQFETDAPMLSICVEKDKYRVSVNQWVPGPGPGDFVLEFKTEEEVYQFTIQYFFEKNEFFDAFRKYWNSQ